MTKEEELIIMLKTLKEQALKSCKDTAVIDVNIDSFNFVIDEVIKALEQQPSEDCVRREQAIKELKESAEHHANNTREEVLLRRDRDIIRALPPVTPTFPKCATNGEAIIRAFPNLKYNIQNGRVITTIGVASSFDLEWWNAPYKESEGVND